MLTHYILDEQGNPVSIQLADAQGNLLIDNMKKWSRWLQTTERHIGDDTFPGDIRVSTVFLSSPRVPSLEEDGRPMHYETMVRASDEIRARLLELSEHDDRDVFSLFFGGTEIQKRYATKEEALEGHARMCSFIEVCITKGLIEAVNPPVEGK